MVSRADLEQQLEELHPAIWQEHDVFRPQVAVHDPTPVRRVHNLLQGARDSLGIFRRTQHLMGLPVIDVDGDLATARTPCTNPMVLADAEGADEVWLIGLWYDDEFARTPEGWRFTSRVQERCYFVTGLKDAAS